MEEEDDILQTNSNKKEKSELARGYSVSLYPYEVEKLKQLGLGLSEATRLGLEVVSKQKSIFIEKAPLVTIQLSLLIVVLALAAITQDPIVYLLLTFILVLCAVVLLTVYKSIHQDGGKK